MKSIINRGDYQLILGKDHLDFWTICGRKEMHGLKKGDQIDGLCNYLPDKNLFVYINLSKCIDDIKTTGLVFHEMMHCSGYLHDGCWDSHEEQMITFAEEETYEIVDIINKLKTLEKWD
jgi:hypothetical protein